MAPGKKKPENISEYIHSYPKEVQEKLNELLASLRKSAPGASESLKWGLPALSYDWILFQFAGFKNYISLYLTPTAVKDLEKDLSGFKSTKMGIQFPHDKPLPLSFIRKIAAFRVKEAKNGVKWM